MSLTFHTNQAPLRTRRSQADGGTTIIALAGDLDSAGAGLLRNEVDNLLVSGARRIVLDCSEVGYASSAGIGALIHTHRAARSAGGRVLVVGTDGPVFEVLGLMNLGSILELYTNEADALSALIQTPAT